LWLEKYFWLSNQHFSQIDSGFLQKIVQKYQEFKNMSSWIYEGMKFLNQLKFELEKDKPSFENISYNFGGKIFPGNHFWRETFLAGKHRTGFLASVWMTRGRFAEQMLMQNILGLLMIALLKDIKLKLCS
jgi:hypothetical protein